MTAQGRGKIFNVLGGGSDGEYFPGIAIYGTTKRGLDYFTTALAKELVLTCRTFDPDEARSWGFINRVVADSDLDDTARNLAQSLVRKAALTLTATKRHVNAIADQAFGAAHSWSEADGLASAMSDPECQQTRRDYLRALGERG